jgi:uncharacterized protein YeaO (DUF488 family)
VAFKHASIYDPPSDADAGLRVLVMRQWPRGVRKDRFDLWLKDAAPGRELLNAYQHAGLAWEHFERRYRAEILEERPDVLDQLAKLEKKHGTVTLLCFERIPPREHCHRLTLMDLLAETSRC